MLFKDPGDISTQVTSNAFSSSTTFYRSIFTYRYLPGNGFENMAQVSQGRTKIQAAIGRLPRWRIESIDAPAGTITATRRTRLFRFTDDVTIRLEATPTGTRIHARSKSRIGKSVERRVGVEVSDDYLTEELLVVPTRLVSIDVGEAELDQDSAGVRMFEFDGGFIASVEESAKPRVVPGLVKALVAQLLRPHVEVVCDRGLDLEPRPIVRHSVLSEAHS